MSRPQHAQVAAPERQPSDSAGVSPLWAWAGLFILLVLSFVAALDRQILSLMVGLIKADLSITDSHIGVLQGAAFGLAYTLFTIPFGYLADRYSRRWVIFWGVIFWSIAAIGSGLAGSFSTLLAARIGVGIGEAALVPAAASLIGDMFPRRRLATAFSIFSAGQLLGISGALAIGGWVISWAENGMDIPHLGHLAAWQIAFIVSGVPATIAAFLIFLVPEKRRPRGGASAEKRQQPAWSDVFAFVKAERRFLGFYVSGHACLQLVGYANVLWIPAVLQRVYGWEVTQVGASLAIFTFAVGFPGALINGMAVDKLFSAGYRDAHLRYFACTSIIITACTVAAPFAATPLIYLAIMAAPKFLLNYGGPAAAALQAITPSHLRGRMTAIGNTISITIGIMAGPSVVAAFTDYLFRDENMVAWSLALTFAIFVPLAGLLFFFAMKPMREAVTRRMDEEAAAEAA
jgi:MFS family permease